jgi:hypothetical protein
MIPLGSGHEASDVRPRAVAVVVLGFFSAIGLSAAFVAGLMTLFSDHDARPALPSLATKHLVSPPPRLEIKPLVERVAVEAEAQSHLQGYAWTDQAAGRARIPIDRAIELLVAHGWPDSMP